MRFLLQYKQEAQDSARRPQKPNIAKNYRLPG